MVEKRKPAGDRRHDVFESSVNSYGRKTRNCQSTWNLMFESSVNSYGRKTLTLKC